MDTAGSVAVGPTLQRSEKLHKAESSTSEAIRKRLSGAAGESLTLHGVRLQIYLNKPQDVCDKRDQSAEEAGLEKTLIPAVSTAWRAEGSG